MGITDKISHAAERKAFETIPDGKWAHYTQRLIRENDPYILKTFLTNAAYEGGFRGYQTAQENAAKYDINVPWLILMDPTSACNTHCTGCWAAEYGHKQSLTFDRVLTEAKALGTHACLFTGGEPLLRKKDIIRLCEKHRDMAFHAFTNGTLIDEEFCQEMLRVGNFFVSISVEGFEEANDGRRGRGHFQKALDAMDLMRSHRIPFGVSICYTSRNYKVVTSDEFLDLLIDKGCVFAWYFHYMPAGLNADAQLPQSPDILRHPAEHGAAAQALIGLLAAAIQRDIEAEGRLMPEEIQPVPVDQGAVAVDGHQQAHFLQLRQQIAEILADQRLAAGQQQEQHAPAAGLFRNGQPLVRRQLPAPALLLLRRQVDIAHFAVEVAPGRQLEIPRQGRTVPAGPGMQIGGQPGFRGASFHVSSSSILLPGSGRRPHPPGRSAAGRARWSPAAPPAPSSARRTPRPADSRRTGSAAGQRPPAVATQ